MKELKSFQEASKEHIYKYLFEQKNNNGRYLLADEVGLGKTEIARAVAEKRGGDVFYVCGNLTLARENEKKLTSSQLNFRRYRDLGIWNILERLSLLHIKREYTKKYREMLELLKACAICLYSEYLQDDCQKSFGENVKNKIFRKKNDIRTKPKLPDCIKNCWKKEIEDKFIKYGIIKKEKDAYSLLVDLCDLLEGRINKDSKKICEYDCEENDFSEVKKIFTKDGSESTLQDDDFGKLRKKMAQFYDCIMSIPDFQLQTITPKTSIQERKTSTIEERLVVKQILLQSCELCEENENGELELHKALEEVIYNGIDKNKKEDFEKVIVRYIEEKENENWVDQILKEDVVKNKIAKYLEAEATAKAEALIYTVLETMAQKALEEIEDGVFIIVDEFQNYPDIFIGEKGQKPREDENVEVSSVAKALLYNGDDSNKKNNKVLLLSATPFQFSKRNKGTISSDVSADTGLTEINYEVDNMLQYIMGEEEFCKWVDACGRRKEFIQNNEIEKAIYCTKCIQKLMYESGISRVERRNNAYEENNIEVPWDYMSDDLQMKQEIDLSLLREFSVNGMKGEEELINHDILIKKDGKILVVREDKIIGKIADGDEVVKQVVDQLKEELEAGEAIEYSKDEQEFVPLEDWEDDWIDDAYGIPIDYLKNTPWALSFSDDYNFFDKITPSSDFCLSEKSIQNKKAVPINNARYRSLIDELFLLKKGESAENSIDRVENLLFIPPSRPDYPLRGVFQEFDNLYEGDKEKKRSMPRYYSKSLIFTNHYNTAKSLAAMLSYHATQYAADKWNLTLKKNFDGNRLAGEIDIEREIEFSEDVSSETKDKIKKFVDKDNIAEYEKRIEDIIKKRVKKAKCKEYEYKKIVKNNPDSSKEFLTIEDYIRGSIVCYLEDYRCSLGCENWAYGEIWVNDSAKYLYSVFKTEDAYYILHSLYDEEYYEKTQKSPYSAGAYMDMIHRYCAEGNIRAVLDEYFQLIREAENEEDNIEFLKILKKDYLKKLSKSMEGPEKQVDVSTIESIGRGRKSKITLGFSDGKINSKKELSEEKLLVFNSPFRPFVFVSTSVGQEGLDFHWYCRNIVHWNFGENPVSLQQKEGRIDRFHCHYVRQNIARDFGKTVWETENVWEAMYKTAKNKVKEKDNTEEGERRSDTDDAMKDMYPDWLYPYPKEKKEEEEEEEEKENYSRLHRSMHYYPLSREILGYEKGRENIRIYRTLLGYSGDIEEDDRYNNNVMQLGDKDMKQLLIDLNPKKQQEQ